MAAKRTVHFVYATPYSLLDKVSMRLVKRKLVHPEWQEFDWPKPLKAPLSITYQVAKRLAGKYRVKLYHLKERIDLKPEQGDILLGHLWPDPDSVVFRSLDNPDFARKILIGPFNHDARQWSALRTSGRVRPFAGVPPDLWWAYDAMSRCDRYIAICGDHWFDTLDRSFLAPFRDKAVHVNMALDTADYPLVKQEFNPPGKRRFFYIGRHAHEKGADLLEELAAAIPGFEGGYICPGKELAGWHRISPPRKLTPEFMQRVAAGYDIFINMSRADAQATTILEAMSWGFPVACTRESGYGNDDFFYLDLHDRAKNISTIEWIQQMRGEDLHEMVRRNRQAVSEKYGWDTFVRRVEEYVTGH